METTLQQIELLETAIAALTAIIEFRYSPVDYSETMQSLKTQLTAAREFVSLERAGI